MKLLHISNFLLSKFELRRIVCPKESHKHHILLPLPFIGCHPGKTVTNLFKILLVNWLGQSNSAKFKIYAYQVENTEAPTSVKSINLTDFEANVGRVH